MVLAAGPSIEKDRDKIIKYYRQFKPTTFTSNQNMGVVNIDYLIFIDNKIFTANIDRVITKNLVIGTKIIWGKRLQVKNKQVYRLDYKHQKNENVNEIKIKSNGKIMHMMGNSGFAAIFTSMFFSPKEIFLAGFDGPTGTDIMHYQEKKSRGKVNKEKLDRLKVFFELMLDHLRNNNVTIATTKDAKLWGINKKKFDIQLR